MAVLALLAACEDDAPRSEPAEPGTGAAGEVLGGSISDEMLPLDRLTSTSPSAEGAEPGEDEADADAGE